MGRQKVAGQWLENQAGKGNKSWFFVVLSTEKKHLRYIMQLNINGDEFSFSEHFYGNDVSMEFPFDNFLQVDMLTFK